jgi:hypothetical protein
VANQSAFVKSNFPRIPEDFYPTIDKRCTYALLEHFRPNGLSIDPCAPNGSGIIDTLKECGFDGVNLPDANYNGIDLPNLTNGKGSLPGEHWITTNPPYDRSIVDDIINRQIERVETKEVSTFACLLRSGFDHAKSRIEMFRNNPFYYGQIKLLFRPVWITPKPGEKTTGPIHQFCWHIWRINSKNVPGVWYSEGKQPTKEILYKWAYFGDFGES